MELRNLGKSGLRVSVIGLGGNNFGSRADVETSRKVVYRALDQGVNLIDTADAYSNQGGSESALGEILGDKRKDVVLATKFGNQMDKEGIKKGGSRRYMVMAVEASLRRLKTDWIDLYQLHWPDPLTPMEETLRALDDLVRHGKVRYIGCSNLQAWQIANAEWISRSSGLERFISAQNEYSLLSRRIEGELLAAIQHFGIGLLPYFPLAAGMLTGKYKRDEPPPRGTRFGAPGRLADSFMTQRNFDIVEKLEAFARARGHTLLELAFSWLACRPAVASVIAGATSPEQVDVNIKSAGWKLTSDEMAEIDRIAV